MRIVRASIISSLAVTACLSAALVAAAQTFTVRVRATIERIEGAVLGVKSREGADFTIRLADNATVTAIVKASLGDIKPGSYVGSAAVPMPDGTLRALEVHIFPEAMRGTGEGHRPHDLLPESTMTNATVVETVSRADGPVLTLKYKDGEKKLFVPSDAPIVTFAPGNRSDLKVGAKVLIPAAIPESDGTFRVMRLSVGRGIDLPM